MAAGPPGRPVCGPYGAIEKFGVQVGAVIIDGCSGGFGTRPCGVAVKVRKGGSFSALRGAAAVIFGPSGPADSRQTRHIVVP